MNRKEIQKRTLIISILIHLFVLLLFIFFAFKHKRILMLAKLTPKQKQQQQKRLAQSKREHYIPVALFPKRSNGGTKVVFDDQMIIPKQPQPKPQPKQEEKLKAIPKPPIPIKKIVTEETKPKQLPIPKKKILTTVSKIPELKEKKEVKKQPKEELIKKIEKEITKQVKKEEIKKEPEKKLAQEVHITLPTTRDFKKPEPEKKPSLLALSKCFLDHYKGNSCMCRKGQDRAPTLEEMKYICYEKKIQDALVASWRSLYAGTFIHAPGETKFTFVVNENGRAEQITIVRSSGNKMFDEMVRESVKQTVFPPIPKHFGVTKYYPQGGLIVLH